MSSDATDKPYDFPEKQVGGGNLKPLTQVLLDRRATGHFKSDPVPDEYIEAILRFGAQAPSGYNLQPWRFIVVRELENRQRLQKAAFAQPKIAEAPVMIIAFAVPGEWRRYMDRIFQESARRGADKVEDIEKKKQTVEKFLGGMSAAAWLNRHTMIAVTTMMLVAESYGLDTAPMEGFDAAAVRSAFGLPVLADVIALLAIGFGQTPDKPYPGRLPLGEIVHYERYQIPAQ
jgi:nitroreductase